jgi:biotin transport system substrate-specific component
MEYALEKNRKNYATLCIIIASSLILSLAAYIRIPLFFTPIPLVIQNSLAVLIGALLGARKGSFAVILFLIYGCFNLPVFAGGNAGLSLLLSPCSGGYLMGYAIAAFVTGAILEKYPKKIFASFAMGHLVILLCGCSFLSLSLGWNKAFYLGVVPFIIPDILKTLFLVKSSQYILKKFSKI